MKKLTYALFLINKLEQKVSETEKRIDSLYRTSDGDDGDEFTTLYARKNAFKQALRMAKTIYTKMSRGNL